MIGLVGLWKDKGVLTNLSNSENMVKERDHKLATRGLGRETCPSKIKFSWLHHIKD